MNHPVITLTSDLGWQDYFVGSIKGVIISINPDARIIDLSHDVERHRIDQAAYLISSIYPCFPEGTIHVVVVDPGVGSPRKPILIQTKRATLIGPDNGVFSYLHLRGETLRCIELLTEEYFFKYPETEGVGATFQGRDIFAPIAAWLSRGIDPARFGEEIEEPVCLPLASPKIVQGQSIEGQVIYIDRFGNLITNITQDHLKTLHDSNPGKSLQIKWDRTKSIPMQKFYTEGAPSKSGALINSNGHLEIFVPLGNAQQLLNASIGHPILITQD